MPPGPRRGGRVAQEFSTATMLTRSGPLGLQWKEVHRHQNEIKRQAAMRKTFSSQQVRGAGRAPHCTGKALSPRKYPFFSQHMRGSGTPRNGKALWPQKKGTLFFKRKALFSSKERHSFLQKSAFLLCTWTGGSVEHWQLRSDSSTSSGRKGGLSCSTKQRLSSMKQQHIKERRGSLAPKEYLSSLNK